MDYKVVVTTDAEEDLERFVKYLIFEKKSLQAAENVLKNFLVDITKIFLYIPTYNSCLLYTSPSPRDS